MKRHILPLLLLFFAAGALFIIKKSKSNQSSGMSFPDRDFAYEKFEDIQSFVLELPDYPKQHFERNEDGWLLNGKYKVNTNVLNNTISVLKGVKIDYIPTKAGTAKILEELKKKAIKIKLFDKKGNQVRSYRVGSETADGSGAPFLMDGADQPYIMHLPGLTGSVRNRLVYEFHELKDKTVFKEDITKIITFELRYPMDKNSSFKIMREGNGFKVVNPDFPNDTGQKVTNQKTVEAYLANLKYIEGEANDENNPRKSEFMAREPFCNVKIGYVNGYEKSMKFVSYLDINTNVKTISPNQVNEDNRYFIYTSDNKSILCQHRVLKNVIKPYLYFF